MQKHLLVFIGIFLSVSTIVTAQTWNPSHKVGTSTNIYNFSYSQTPDQLVELFPAGIPNTGLSYQWEYSTLPTGSFTNISGATSTSYTFSAPISQTTYYRRKTTNGLSQSIYSNIVKVTVVSVNWEDMNYLRQHDVLTTNISTWTAVDQLTIGDKLQTTTYLDGLGRQTETVCRETATPIGSSSTWGDIVQVSQYDAYGREPVKYLPYTTTTQPGKYKSTAMTEQPVYYTTTYSETSAFSNITFDNSPFNRVLNVKQPGAAWASAAGSFASYDLNSSTDDVKYFNVDYVRGNKPIYVGAYPVKSLYKLTYTDENGKAVIQFINKSGQQVLKKVQLDNSPSTVYTGWICTYSVYDDFGLLRYQIQPEGVKYLEANSWSFTGTNGQTILDEQCFQYDYDEKGRNVWKKAPGAAPLNMIYDDRDRMVFMQDGNQAALSTPQWTTTLYDEFDRPIISTLYNTTKTISTLQSDISSASTLSSVTISSNPSTVSVTASLHKSPLSSTNLNSSSTTTILKYNFYDDYSFSTVKTFNTSFTNTTVYSTSDPNVQAITKTFRTISMPTGSLTRVLGSTTFLSATHYYDERGEHIQMLEDNLKSGVDITTIQYHFDGRVLSSCSDHSTTGAGYTNFQTLTKYLFDRLGRVTSIQKKYGSNVLKTMYSYVYDDAGRLKSKLLDPGYTGNGHSNLETLDFSYNIHNQITGINKDYALKTGTFDKWQHFFGMYLGFDNSDAVFTNANLTGQVTGQLWTTQGDDAQRKFDYEYDNAGRFVNALFKEKQHTGDSWSNSTMDYSVSGTSGKITYDLNGNLLNMLQKGVIPGSTSPVTVDELSYTYASYSNKLQSVTDNMTSTTVNGAFGDFKDGANGSGTPDYVYDANGNVVIDLNKNAKDIAGVTGANGIKYNFLDKPEEIRISGKGTIQIVYSADGEKLQRKFTSETVNEVKTITYINQFIYEESATTTGTPIKALAVTSINFEEGRIRVIDPTSQGNGLDALIVDGNMDLPNDKRGAYDYYVMDYQQNVRMILTEEIHTASNTATMETARATLEESIFGQTGGGNEVALTRYAASSTSWPNLGIGDYVSRVGINSGHTVGPNTLQKVMAGDEVNATVMFYYNSAVRGWSNGGSILTNVTSSLLAAINGGNATGDLIKGNSSAITTQLGGVSEFINAVEPLGSSPSTTPIAYLTILFFDERFNLVPAADGGVAQQRVYTPSSSVLTIDQLVETIKAPKNGYAFVYVSNQSNFDVYFDNLQVGITQGNIAEENHYYPYGLKIATLSSKKLGDVYEGSLKNNYLYQGAYSELDDDIGWNDFMLRNYDAQIGRWVQQDPYQQFASPYVGMGSDPVNTIDPNGGETLPFQVIKIGGDMSKTAATGITLGGVVLCATRASSLVTKATYTLTTVSKISIILHTVSAGIKIINTSIISLQAGDLGAIKLRGYKDAWANAAGLGFHDAFWGSNLKDYKDPYEQEAYLQGRLWADASIIVISAATTEAGLGAAGRSAITPGGQVVTAGALAASAYGATVGGVAAADAAWATTKLMRIGESPGYWENHPDNISTQHEPNWYKKEKAKEAADAELPSLDATGKVHGELPKPKDFNKYSEGALRKLYNELKTSVQKRIEVTSQMGRDRGHGQRQGAEQNLIQALEKYLGK